MSAMPAQSFVSFVKVASHLGCLSPVAAWPKVPAGMHEATFAVHQGAHKGPSLCHLIAGTVPHPSMHTKCRQSRAMDRGHGAPPARCRVQTWQIAQDTLSEVKDASLSA